MLARVVVPGPTRHSRLVEHAVDHVACDRRLGRAIRLAAVRALPPCRRPGSTGHAGPAAQPRGDGSRAQRLLVHVHDLGLGGLAAGRLGAQSSASRPALPRVDGEDGGMHLHARRDADHRHPAAHGAEHVHRRPVAAREEQAPHSGAGERLRRRPRVGRRSSRLADLPITSGSMPALRASSSPISARPRRAARSLRPRVQARGAPSAARPGETGSAPRAIASPTRAGSSDPLRA